MAELKAEVGANLALYRVHVDELREQDVNARVMPPEMFERLTETIKAEGRLEQLPFVVARKGFFEVISGHHRLRAARAAGMTEIFVLADTRDLARSKVVAKQLAHNKISGTDDQQTLKRLYDEIQSVEDQLESYIRADDFDEVKQLEPTEVSDINLTIPWRQLSLVFLPPTLDRIEQLDEWAKRAPRTADAIGVCSMEVFDRFRNAVLAIGKVENVRSLGAVMTRMLEIVDNWIEEHGDSAPGAGTGPVGPSEGALRDASPAAAGERQSPPGAG